VITPAPRLVEESKATIKVKPVDEKVADKATGAGGGTNVLWIEMLLILSEYA